MGSKGGQDFFPFAHANAVARRPSPQALGDDSERRAFEAKLREQAGARFAGVRQARLAEAERHISDLLSAAGRKLNGVGTWEGGGGGGGRVTGRVVDSWDGCGKSGMWMASLQGESS